MLSQTNQKSALLPFSKVCLEGLDHSHSCMSAPDTDNQKGYHQNFINDMVCFSFVRVVCILNLLNHCRSSFFCVFTVCAEFLWWLVCLGNERWDEQGCTFEANIHHETVEFQLLLVELLLLVQATLFGQILRQSWSA